MGKKHTTLNLDEDILNDLRLMGVNLSGEVNKFLIQLRDMRVSVLEDSLSELREKVENEKAERQVRKSALQMRRDLLKKQTDDMVAFITSPEASGMSKPEAETAFNHVFPDGLWESVRGDS